MSCRVAVVLTIHQCIYFRGMTVTSGTAHITKDGSNLIGISIGGGAPYCPCIYIIQVFDGTPAASEGSMQSGDELTSINGNSVKNKTKVEVAKMIQATEKTVVINYNKLHADAAQASDSLDIALKRVKHRFVESISANTADNLGLSRAMLCNDSLVKRLQELQATESMYRGLVDHARRMLKAHFDVIQSYQQFATVLSAISVREPQSRASEAFRLYAEMHRQLERDGIKMVKAVKPVLGDLGTYLHKAIPDTKLTVRKYANAKFTYLSYCLKVKEMDDEEHSYAALQEPLYRVETGNYEYRLILRCRQESRGAFARLRSDVLEKIELLESKHVQDLTGQLRKIIDGLKQFSADSKQRLEQHSTLFPIEVDLKQDAFQYAMSANIPKSYKDDPENDNEEEGEEQSQQEKPDGEEEKKRVNNSSTKIQNLVDIEATEALDDDDLKDLLMIPDLNGSTNAEVEMVTNIADDLLLDFGLLDTNEGEKEEEKASSTINLLD